MTIRRAMGILAFAVVFAACGGDEAETDTGTEDGGSAGVEITIVDFTFTGSTTAAVDETVTVTNDDSATHTWTSRGGVFDSGNLAPGDSFDFAFTEPGDYDFFCQIHPQMSGTITVEG